MAAKTCNYASCLETVEGKGIVVSLKTATFDGESRAIFCCAAHAAASLLRLAADRDESTAELPRTWRVT
jgi:hypothetical protein